LMRPNLFVINITDRERDGILKPARERTWDYRSPAAVAICCGSTRVY